MTARRILLIVLDGIGDRPHPALGGATPLSAARTPVLDRMAREGVTGIMDTIAPGIRPGSDTSHLALLGYPPEEYYTGRGPLEAEGSGIRMRPGMIGFRANYATLGPERDSSRTGAPAGSTGPSRSRRRSRTVSISCPSASPSASSRAPATAPRSRSRARGSATESARTTRSTRAFAPTRFEPTTVRPEDVKTAAVLNEFVRQARPILFNHPLNRERLAQGLPPANEVLLRGAGRMGHFEPFGERYGLSGAVVAAATLITGIGKVVGLETIHVEGATGSVDTNLEGKVRAVVDALETHGFVLLNIKGADESGHDGKAEQKRDFIERIDGALAPFLDLPETVIAVCGDHSTPCTVMDHSADPVPVLVRGEGVQARSRDEVRRVSLRRGRPPSHPRPRPFADPARPDWQVS